MAATPGGKGNASTGDIINLDLCSGFSITDHISGVGTNVSDVCFSVKCMH